MEIIIVILPIVLAIGVWNMVRVRAKKHDGICRWYWNTSFKLAAFIPLCGWMACFIIGEEREAYEKIGKATDDLASEVLTDALERHKAEQRRQEAVRKELAARGYVDVSLNSDSSFATAKDRSGNSYNIHITDE